MRDVKYIKQVMLSKIDGKVEMIKRRMQPYNVIIEKNSLKETKESPEEPNID